KEIRPGRTLDVNVKVTDAKGGKVVNAAVAMVAVDEGVCAVSNFVTPSPLAYFWGRRGLGVATADIYGDLMPEIEKAAAQSGVGGDGGSEAPASGSAGARHLSVVSAKRVRPVALISAVVHTDGDGNASVHFQVPAFLGQLRVMAVAYKDEKMGSDKSGVIV